MSNNSQENNEYKNPDNQNRQTGVFGSKAEQKKRQNSGRQQPDSINTVNTLKRDEQRDRDINDEEAIEKRESA